MTTGGPRFTVLLLPLAMLISCGYFDLLDPDGPDPVDTSISWQAHLGGVGEDVACCVQETADGGFILTGQTDSFGAGLTDVWLVKTDGAGVEQWSKTFGGTQEEQGHCVQQTADKGYVLVGSTRSFGAGQDDVYLVKTDEVGNKQWSNTFGGSGVEVGCSVQCTGDGGYIIAGSTSPGTSIVDVLLIKTDELGNEVWSKTFGDTFQDCGFCVRQTADGGYIVAGLSESQTVPPNVDENAYLLKIDASGNKQWSRSFGLEWPDGATGVEQTADGGYVLAGYTRSYGEGDFNAWLIKTDADGNAQWEAAYGGNSWELAKGVQQASDGGYIVVGTTTSFGAWKQAWLIKTDAVGTQEWSKTFGGDADEWGLAVQQTSDGGYILAGKTTSFGVGDLDAYLVYFKP
jgi:hypothetical protein